MAYTSYSWQLSLVLFVVLLVPIRSSEEQHNATQEQTLLRIQTLLYYPVILSNWNNTTDFCNTVQSPPVTVICYEDVVTQLHIINTDKTPPLPRDFSIDTFFATLVRLPSLKVLTLVSLGLWGHLPPVISGLSSLEILNVTSNYFSGPIPPELTSLTDLQSLVLDDNTFSGWIPNRIGFLSCLSVLSMKNNSLNGLLPDSLGSLVDLRVLVASHNNFSGQVLDLRSLTNLQVLDVEDNSLGPEFPQVSHRIISVMLRANKFGSGVPDELSSFYQLRRLDIALNQFVGPFPTSILSLPSMTRLDINGNRFTGMVFKDTECSPELEFVDLSDNLLTGYVTRVMKLGTLSVPAYRAFSLEELKEATNGFETLSFMGEGSHGQMYKGRLKDGSYIAIQCLKMKKTHSTQTFTHQIELMSKLRHQHMVCALGHCFEFYLDDSSVSRLFLVFEFVPNGSLRDWISGSKSSKSLTWSQRIAAAIGIVKGIQFLHSGIMPRVFSSNLNITDILLDQNFVAKLCSYNLLLFAGHVEKDGAQSYFRRFKASNRTSVSDPEKVDVYDFGVILLEIISGRPLRTQKEVDSVKEQFQARMTTDDADIKDMVDSAVRNTCSDQSLMTMIEVCNRCLLHDPAERPSVEDMLWNLQFAAQVQDAWQSTEGSPISSSQPAITQN